MKNVKGTKAILTIIMSATLLTFSIAAMATQTMGHAYADTTTTHGGAGNSGGTNSANQGIGQSQLSQGNDTSSGNGNTKPPADLPKTKSH